MTVYLQDPDVTLYHGDALETLRTLLDESVHCVCTSPPYWGLRDYSAPGQMGLEPTPELYVQNMVAVFREVRRVLRRDGTCWLNIGDSYAHNGACGGSSPDGDRAYRATDRAKQEQMSYRVPPGLKPKDLVGIPWKLAFALQQDGWWLRADIIWAKPNPMPESVTDRPTKAHEYVFLLTRSPRYFFDQEAVREPYLEPERVASRYVEGFRAETYGSRYVAQGAAPSNAEHRGGRGPDGRKITHVEGKDGSAQHRSGERWPHPTGRNVRSVWEIATEPFPQAHFATFPTELARRCILAGTSERGCCPECGAPWVRVVETNNPSKYAADEDARGWANTHSKTGNPQSSKSLHRNPGGVYSSAVTLGWRPTCGCIHSIQRGPNPTSFPHLPTPCTVLDPFAGACTVPLVARNHGRHAIGIELSETYLRNIALPRLQQLSLLTGAST